MQSRHLGKSRQKKYHWQRPRGDKTDNMLWEQAIGQLQEDLSG